MKRVSASTIADIREKTDIVAVVEDTVALRRAGTSWKGLCPFHHESTPSFTVTPGKNMWYCFGCGEGGDVIDYVQQRDSYSFVEAVEVLANRSHVPLVYEDGDDGETFSGVSTRRVIAVNTAAMSWFCREWEQLPHPHPAREFLAAKHLDDATLVGRFRVGWGGEPRNGYNEAAGGGGTCSEYLLKEGFTRAEIVESGVVGVSASGAMYDRFRARVVWPIRNAMGHVIGFGGRKIYDSTKGGKYVNTSDTPVYRKTDVLFNLDHARQHAPKEGKVVVVEGYTDVMALEAAGIHTAVAACGTAFGERHATLLKRVLGDGVRDTVPPQVVFMFDGDEAGKKAALRAENVGNVFVGETFAVELPAGQDPCDVWIGGGADAVQRIVNNPSDTLTGFALRSLIMRHNLDTPEGKVAAAQDGALFLTKLHNPIIKNEYTQRLAQHLGIRTTDIPTVRTPMSHQPPPAHATDSDPLDTSHTNPHYTLEEETLLIVLQHPHLAQHLYSSVEPDAYTSPHLRNMHNLITATYHYIDTHQHTITDATWHQALLTTYHTATGNTSLPPTVTRLLVQEPKAYLATDAALHEHVRTSIITLIDHHAQRLIANLRQQHLSELHANLTTTDTWDTLISVEQYRKELPTWKLFPHNTPPTSPEGTAAQ